MGDGPSHELNILEFMEGAHDTQRLPGLIQGVLTEQAVFSRHLDGLGFESNDCLE